MEGGLSRGSGGSVVVGWFAVVGVLSWAYLGHSSPLMLEHQSHFLKVFSLLVQQLLQVTGDPGHAPGRAPYCPGGDGVLCV